MELIHSVIDSHKFVIPIKHTQSLKHVVWTWHKKIICSTQFICTHNIYSIQTQKLSFSLYSNWYLHRISLAWSSISVAFFHYFYWRLTIKTLLLSYSTQICFFLCLWGLHFIQKGPKLFLFSFPAFSQLKS